MDTTKALEPSIYQQIGVLHPVAQVTVIITIGVVVGILVYNYFKLLRGE